MNNFTAAGNLGKDCEQKYMPSGSAICVFSLPVKSGFGDKQKTTWIECAMFGKKAEGKLPGYLLKGQAVCVSGEIFLDEFQGQDGNVRKSLKMNIDKIDLIGGASKPNAQRQQNHSAGMQQARNAVQGNQQNTQQEAGPMDDFDDDIPF